MVYSMHSIKNKTQDSVSDDIDADEQKKSDGGPSKPNPICPYFKFALAAISTASAVQAKLYILEGMNIGSACGT